VTAQLHPNVLGALSALADLSDQHCWLDDLKEPGRRQRTARPSLTPAAKAVLDRQARAERRDQVETLRAGLKPSGGSAAPLDMSVLYAQMHAREVAHDTAIIASSALRTRPMLAYAAAHGHGTDEARFARAVSYLQVALRLVSPELAGQLGADLNSAANLCHLVSGHHPDRRPFREGPCPACGRDGLQVQTTGTEEPALIFCPKPDCKCRGIDCLCKRPFRMPGREHVWRSDEDEFEQLKRRLEEAA
jgi:hypothetical protein